MAQPTIEELKAGAFALSKILSTHHVKLSSQQCLDVLTRLTSNVPYEALLAQHRSGETEQRPSTGPIPDTLASWFDLAETFCDLVATLDHEGVNQAAYPGQSLPGGLHRDGRSYLLAAGDVAACFARSARTFVMAQIGTPPAGLVEKLRFTVQASEPVVEGKLATLRIQYLDAKHARPGLFEDIQWQSRSEPLLFGAEARIELITCLDLERYRQDEPFVLVPGVRLSYEVCSQASLAFFARILRETAISELWPLMDAVRIETSILLTRDDDQESIEEEWGASEPGSVERLADFCERASQLSDEETCDWPPYCRLTRALDRSCSDDDLRDAFASLCVLAISMVGPSGGWHEILNSLPRSLKPVRS